MNSHWIESKKVHWIQFKNVFLTNNSWIFIPTYMKQITLQIPDEKFTFIIELLQQLGVQDIHENDLYIPEWQKNIVSERMENMDIDTLIDIEQFEKAMQKKYGL